jgi:hypothetical protein
MLEGAKQEGTSDVAYSQNQPPVVLSETSNPKRIAEVGEEPSDLGGGSDWGTGDRDAGAKRERALRRFEELIAIRSKKSPRAQPGGSLVCSRVALTG